MHNLRLVSFLLIAFGGFVAFAADTPIEPTEAWNGKIADEALNALAPQSEVIADEATWAKVWKGWRPNEDVPELNFDQSLVLVGTAPGPNRVSLRPVLNEGGDLRFLAVSTRIGGPGFGYTLVAIPRKGIKTVNGRPLRGSGPESITVEVVGRLKTGIFAIGGETTGTTITANGVIWELDLGNEPSLQAAAEQLNEQLVRVTGRLERRPGVEIPVRWIVTVARLSASAADNQRE